MLIDFRERGKDWERKKHWWEKHRLVAFHMHSNWESKPQPFSVREEAPNNWASHPARATCIFLTEQQYVHPTSLNTTPVYAQSLPSDPEPGGTEGQQTGPWGFSSLFFKYLCVGTVLLLFLFSFLFYIYKFNLFYSQDRSTLEVSEC